MTLKRRILWVEDSADSDLSPLAAWVYLDGRYELVVAPDVSEAVERSCREEFAAMIVDIRLPPGRDPRWLGLYKKMTAGGVAPNLGLQMIRSLLGHDTAEIKIEPPPAWLSPEKIAVFTIDCHGALLKALGELGIEVIRQKQAGQPQTALLDIILETCPDQSP
ncbi:MAG TPA: hypothetical protein VM936_02910 [Pyrinomonadaceae bacterium]|jgi:hypothetical protein|nr:hypothetical protein [Pyrinomonadaceae bacterium]